MEEIRNIVGNMLDSIPEPEMGPGDFVKDGLIFCGKCGMAKQKIIWIPWSKRQSKVPVTCKCRQEEMERRKQEQEFEEQMRMIQRLKDASMMDSKYRDASFDRYEVTEENRKVKAACEQYVRNFDKMYDRNQGILFYGGVGTGKSYTAACIANALLSRKVTVIMTSFVKIMQALATTEEGELLTRLNSAKLLILDDLGAERKTEYALEKVYNVIDSRSRASKPMILTTNLKIGEMMDTADIGYRRVYDRIFETCYPLEVPGQSFRIRAAERRFDDMKALMEEK